jgi:hypothetical protein
MTEPAFTCPIVADGKRCDVAISAKHWACRRHWLLFPVRFRNNAPHTRALTNVLTHAKTVGRCDRLCHVFIR